MALHSNNEGNGVGLSEPSGIYGVTDAPKKRPSGRPKGSRNKFSADARAVLAEQGPNVAMALCKLAQGRAIYCRDIDPDTGRRRVLRPGVSDVIDAQRVVVERLMPKLSAAAIDAVVTESDRERPSDRALAMAVMTLIREAGAEVVEADPIDGALAEVRAMTAQGVGGHPTAGAGSDDHVPDFTK